MEIDSLIKGNIMNLDRVSFGRNVFNCKFCHQMMKPYGYFPRCETCDVGFLLFDSSEIIHSIYFGWTSEFQIISCLYKNNTSIVDSHSGMFILNIDSVITELNPDNAESICDRLLKSKAFI